MDAVTWPEDLFKLNTDVTFQLLHHNLLIINDDDTARESMNKSK